MPWEYTWIGSVLWALRRLFRRWRRGPEGTWLALWSGDRVTGDEPDLVFPIRPGVLPDPGGVAAGAVLGEYGPNGALVVRIAGSVVHPIYNPQVPWGDLARRLSG